MLKPFLRVVLPEEARGMLKIFGPLDTEQISIENSLFRVIAEVIKASEDSPPFDRSTMDGFAVRSVDTFGATETSPALAKIAGEITMGSSSEKKVKKGEAYRIWTGGVLPPGSDAVVMLEHTEEIDRETIEILKAVAPFDNVIRKGEDFKAGETLIGIGHRIRPQDIGLFAAMGKQTLTVFKKPLVAVISSGDEIVPIDQEPPPGCVRDINRYTLTAMISEAHANPLWIAIAPDNLKALANLMNQAMRSADIVIISGGSSMGSRDHVIEAIKSYPDSEILFHGVSVSPGKPLILAKIGRTPVVGLPGHPVSAMICFEQFVAPLIRRLEGEQTTEPFLRPTLKAVLSRNVPSKEGRTDFVRVRLRQKDGHTLAVPVPGKSGVISAMVRSHGYIRIEADCEGLYKGDEITVHLFSNWIGDSFEKEHLSGHEASRGSAGDIPEPSRQEKLSGA